MTSTLCKMLARTNWALSYIFLRKKSIFDRPTIIRVQVWPSNSKTTCSWSCNFQNRLYLTIRLFWRVVLLKLTTPSSGATYHLLFLSSLSSFLFLSFFSLSLLRHSRPSTTLLWRVSASLSLCTSLRLHLICALLRRAWKSSQHLSGCPCILRDPLVGSSRADALRADSREISDSRQSGRRSSWRRGWEGS